ncbi:MAG TPA: hypothetical protein ENN60_03350, partial [archaeon]|nr:hypothetical protein [archaeon]
MPHDPLPANQLYTAEIESRGDDYSINVVPFSPDLLGVDFDYLLALTDERRINDDICARFSTVGVLGADQLLRGMVALDSAPARLVTSCDYDVIELQGMCNDWRSLQNKNFHDFCKHYTEKLIPRIKSNFTYCTSVGARLRQNETLGYETAALMFCRTAFDAPKNNWEHLLDIYGPGKPCYE